MHFAGCYADCSSHVGELKEEIRRASSDPMSGRSAAPKGIVVVGERGSGKTAVLSRVAGELWSSDGVPLACHNGLLPFTCVYFSIAHPFADWPDAVASVMSQVAAGLEIPEASFSPGLDAMWVHTDGRDSITQAVCSFRGAWLRQAAMYGFYVR